MRRHRVNEVCLGTSCRRVCARGGHEELPASDDLYRELVAALRIASGKAVACR
ncbi:hypothetical protein [Nonomuraea sp. NPDC049480]|uniref:hypothetical protein n=1 Tax=Nonomuraea sp. NPDC049480 TaxID=3364353 RepID=UPI003791DBD9